MESTTKAITHILEDHLRQAGLSAYLVVKNKNEIAPEMPVGVPLLVVGLGVGSGFITYGDVPGWDAIEEDDPYFILKVPGSPDDASGCYALRQNADFDVLRTPDGWMIERIVEDILVECDLHDEVYERGGV